MAIDNYDIGTKQGAQNTLIDGELNSLFADIVDEIDNNIIAKTDLKGKTLKEDFWTLYDDLFETINEMKIELRSMLEEISE